MMFSSMAAYSPLPSIDDERRMVRLVAAPVEIEFVDNAGRDALVMLSQIEEKRVGHCREDMN